MLLYLIIPAMLWLCSYNFLIASKGQKGLDIFFKQFLLIAAEVVASLLLLDYFQVEGGNRICMAILAVHTVILFGYAAFHYLKFKGKGRNKQLA